jgi:prophage DNA circulation protein
VYKFEAKEAVPLCARVLKVLLTQAPTRGRSGSSLRRAVGDFILNSQSLLQNDLSGPPLDEIFELARLTGINLAQFAEVRNAATLENPQTVGATIIKNALIQFCIAAESRILVDTQFVSRNDVDAVKKRMNEAFVPMQDVAADEMAQMTYQALVGLHAAVIFFLTETARPLAMVLRYRFYQSLPTLVMAYRLYADASRADELRVENKNVHPAFMLPTGVALSN